MSKKEQFVKLPHWVLKSESHRALSPQAKIVHLYLLTGFNGGNNGTIKWTHRQLADASNMHRNVVRRALHELIAAGVITCTSRSGFNVKNREPSTYRINWLFGAKTTPETAP